MDGTLITVLIVGAAVVVAVVVMLRAQSTRAEAAADKLAELSGRLQQMGETQATAQAQINRTLEERLDAVVKRLGDGLADHTEKTGKSISAVQERLVQIDAAQKNLMQLSEQVVGLRDVLSNKQARGAFGEIQLNDLVASILPPSAYEFQATLGNNKRVDCLIKLPNPPGTIAVDAKFPLESYRAIRDAGDDDARARALKAFGADIMKHVNDIAEKYIVPGETAESALMFLPSEAVYAELHASLPEIVDKSYRARVWIVSPTTLMATLNTVRAVLKDARMRDQAGVIQTEVLKLLEDVGRMDDRVAKLQRHFGQEEEDVRQIRISTDKVTKRGERIEDVQLGDDTGTEEMAPPDKPKLREV